MVHEDLVLMPEVDARRVLSGRALSFRLLAPVSPSLGVGRLRVLRVRPFDTRPWDAAQGNKDAAQPFDTRPSDAAQGNKDAAQGNKDASFDTRPSDAAQDDTVIELICGYESYERIDA